MASRRTFLGKCASCVGMASLFAGANESIAQEWPNPSGSADKGRKSTSGWPTGLDAPESSAGSSSRSARAGCYLSRSAAGGGSIDRSKILARSGIDVLDGALPNEANLLSRTFGVTPGFFYLDDDSGANAFATPAKFTRDSINGSVLFGIRLLQEELRGGYLPGNSIVGILAHEYAHIMQFANSVERPGKHMELHADLMAGWYLGLKTVSGIPGIDIRVLATSLFNKGDYAFNSPTHHGTPAERVQAMVAGFDMATRGVRTPQQAFGLGAQVVGL